MINKKDLSIVIADDHPMLLKGLYEELTAHKYQVIGQATDGMKALEIILTQKPTIALLDIDMPHLTGFEVVKMCKDKGCATKFIMLSFHKEADYILQAKGLQINGYLLKEDSFIEIERCINAVINNQIYFSNSFNNLALDNASQELQKLQMLTPSEMTILKRIALQNTTNDIANELCVSVRTIEKHRSNIINKLNIEKGTNALTSWALINKNVILEV